MRTSRLQSGRDADVHSDRTGSRVSAIALALLVVLSVWALLYEVGNTVLPALGRGAAFQGIGHDVAFALAAALLIVRGLRGERGWALIGVGALCWAAGDVYWTYALATMNAPPVPSWADAGYLSFCPLWFAGILALVRRRTARPPRTLVADALAASLAAGALSAAVVLKPVLESANGGSLAVATNIAYPLCDMLLLGLIVGATALGNWRLSRTWVLLGVSVIAFWIADSLYLVTVANGTYQQSAWFNPLWYWSPVLVAWAAWLPRAAVVAGAQRNVTARGIVMPLAFALGALAILVWSSFDRVGVTAIVMATGSLLVIMCRLALTWRENSRLLRASRDEALTDSLTGLPNRRALAVDLERRMATASRQRPFVLVLFDLDGFKHYNDNFGHPAGDALLQRLGRSLGAHLATAGAAYRMGGDEFCALIDVPEDGSGIELSTVANALSEHGEAFSIGCSFGWVQLPDEAEDSATALGIADQRMYAQKRRGRASASRQSRDVLVRALTERNPELGAHLHGVADLAGITATMCSLSAEETEWTRQAAELHDVGKVAIPDAILNKPAALDENEWAFIRRHTLIGERIVAAAPDLRRVAALIRSSHERYDGNGYPDALAGDDIPLGSRIIAVCDAFDAMTTDRPYRQAMAVAAAIGELRRCAGSQFDPVVVERFVDALRAPKTKVSRAA